MMIILSLAVMICTFCVVYCMNVQRRILNEQRIHNNILKDVYTISVSLRGLQTSSKKVFAEQKIEEKQTRPANRKPRTEEQRKHASETRKAYWAAKRLEKASQTTQPSQESPQAVNA